MIVVTHYQRLLNYIIPDFVHVLVEGRIADSGGKELALELEAKGYAWLEKEPAGAERDEPRRRGEGRLPGELRRFARAPLGRGSGLARSLRTTAMARFAERGFPTTRTRPGDTRAWRPSPARSSGPPRPARREGAADGRSQDLRLRGTRRHRGRLRQRPLRSGRSRRRPAGVAVLSLRQALEREPELWRPISAASASPGGRFADLNTAFVDDGACVFIPAGRHVRGNDPPRLPVHQPRGADGLPPADAGRRGARKPGAARRELRRLRRRDLLDERGDRDRPRGRRGARPREAPARKGIGGLPRRHRHGAVWDATRASPSHAVTLGGALSRDDLGVTFAGEGGECVLNGLFVGSGDAAHGHPHPGRPRPAPPHEPGALQGDPGREGPRRLRRPDHRAEGRPEDRRPADQQEPAALAGGPGPQHAGPRDPGRRREVQARLHDRAARRDGALLPAVAGHRRGGGAEPAHLRLRQRRGAEGPRRGDPGAARGAPPVGSSGRRRSDEPGPGVRARRHPSSTWRASAGTSRSSRRPSTTSPSSISTTPPRPRSPTR